MADRLEINEDEQPLAAWAYADIRRADSPAGMLRVSCLTAPALARLEVRDTVLAGQLVSRCAGMDDDIPGRRGVAAIIGWSLAATVSIIAVVLFGLPLAADRLAPLVPAAFERRLGDVADAQVKKLFGAKVCDNAAGEKAFVKLVTAICEFRRAGYVRPVRRAVELDSECLRVAGRQGLFVQRTAGEGRERR